MVRGQGWPADMARAPRLAGVELGGTKAIVVLAQAGQILAQQAIATQASGETLGWLNAILRGWHQERGLDGLGIATFGPVQLDPGATNFACLLDTPKPGWSTVPIAEPLMRGLACPWRIDTDVNAAALAEYHWGAAQGCSSVCYITVGTGVGGGLVIDGRPLHGAMHPEIGHLSLRRAHGDSFAGACRFHGDCVEGLVSGPALTERFGMPADRVPADHPVWSHVAADLGELAASILLTTSADRVLLGGSVALKRAVLIPGIHAAVVARLGGYLPLIDAPSVARTVRLAGLGPQAGPLGALVLASLAAGSPIQPLSVEALDLPQ